MVPAIRVAPVFTFSVCVFVGVFVCMLCFLYPPLKLAHYGRIKKIKVMMHFFSYLFLSIEINTYIHTYIE